MTPERVLFLTDKFDETATHLAGLHQFKDQYQVTFKNRIDALTHTAADFDLIVIVAEDSSMMSALASCRRLRSNTKGPILFVGPVDNIKAALAAYDAGADDYIDDSISIVHWNAKLRAWLRWTVAAMARESADKDDVSLM